MNKYKVFSIGLVGVLSVIVVACSWIAQASVGEGDSRSEAIAAKALDDLVAKGWDMAGATAEVEAVDGDFARVLIHTVNPPGGFTAFIGREAGEWRLLAEGSAFNPADLQALGIPNRVLGAWAME
jgi:hypothetical protein